jgi:hypothetical protein
VSAESPPGQPVRPEVVEVLRRLEPFRLKSHAADHYAAVLSPEELALLASATDDERRVAAIEALRGLASIVDMGDGTLARLPDDPDWS